MHSIDLKNYQIRTDLVIEDLTSNEKIEGIIHKQEKFGDVFLDEVEVTEKGSKLLKRKTGLYKTITFTDVTDKDHYKKVEDIFIKTFKKILKEAKIKENGKALIIGLGNEESTPDALGPKVINQVLVTRYLFELGDVEKGYRNVCSFKPNVTGVTGIETWEVIESLVESVKPDFLIVIDSLAASSLERLNKTIQITDTGISPGSGIGNTRKELSRDTLNIPVIAIGVPTIVDAVTIVVNTFHYLLKQISYKIENQDNPKLKLVSILKQNYIDQEENLTEEQKEEVLGMVGGLKEEELRSLIEEVLTPIGYNYMVTPKEIDFVIEKLSLLISSGINKSLHEAFNPTN